MHKGKMKRDLENIFSLKVSSEAIEGLIKQKSIRIIKKEPLSF